MVSIRLSMFFSVTHCTLLTPNLLFLQYKHFLGKAPYAFGWHMAQSREYWKFADQATDTSIYGHMQCWHNQAYAASKQETNHQQCISLNPARISLQHLDLALSTDGHQAYEPI